jgi:thiamine-phosphate pyrophosphorylase
VNLPDRLLLVVEPTQATPAVLEPLLAAGLRWFWLRAKTMAVDEIEALLKRLLPRLAGVTLSLGGHPALAARFGLACHLPRDGDVGAARRLGLPLLGYSAHDLGEARAALAAGADYVTLSPVFVPISKPLRGAVLGLAGLAAAASALPGQVVALGGVTAERLPACLAAGAGAAALAGAIFGAADPSVALAGCRAAASRLI